MKPRILVIEDERTARQSLALLLEDEGYGVLTAESGEMGLELALREEPELILLDIRLPGEDGISILKKLRAGHSESAVIIMTAETNSSNAILATQNGAFDYIAKPIHDDHLLVVIRRALEYRHLEQQLKKLGRSEGEAPLIPGMVGHSVAMQEVYKTIGRVANSTATVLISGESGTGKELVAHALHEFSQRAQGPLVKVNCAAIPENLLEAELFGHERGAFTNALSRRIGRFEQAQRGTLFLDEIAELPLALQAKLLRAIQERKIERLGSNTPLPVDFRLLAATARDLRRAVGLGQFREDLFYRLNVVEIQLPPLRQRREDIPLLIQRFLNRSERPVSIRGDALEKLMEYDWPGNVRELENVITRAIVLSPGGVISPENIQLELGGLQKPQPGAMPFEPREGYWNVIRRVEKHLLETALKQAGGNKAEAARLLGIQRRLLYEKLAEFGLG